MTTTTLTPPASDLEIETGAIIRELQNKLINDNPLNYESNTTTNAISQSLFQTIQQITVG